MRTPRALVLLSPLFLACGTGGRRNTGGGDGGPPDLSVGFFDLAGVEPGDLANMGCATATHEAKQAPAAMMVLLDRSESMSDGNKYTFAAQAIVQAVDGDVFDSMWVGLYAAPSGQRNGPQCIFGLPVACLTSPFPQIELKAAGADKSTAAMGVRRAIKDWLTNNGPLGQLGDASPLYDAMQASLLALQSWPQAGKRILFVVTDGTISCNQFSNRPGFPDCNGCNRDWEDPANLVKLLGDANKDPMKPVETFIVGVPGADTYDAQGCMYPPYRMRNALSAIAYAGSPKFVPQNCTGKTFAKGGADPAVSCHFDLTQGNFKAQAVADAIGQIRGKVLGCTYELPRPDGGTIDKDYVNVSITVNGNSRDLFRRKDPQNPCVNNGCWDWVGDKIQLIGSACNDVQNAMNAKVKITVGCQTVIG